MTDSPQPIPPFGTHALGPVRDRLRRASGRARTRGRWLASWLRNAAVAGRSEPFDVQPAPGFRVRLWPSENATDKLAFVGLEIADAEPVEAMAQAIASCPHPKVQLLDIGANSGLYAIAAAQAVRASGRHAAVLAVEANSVMAERARFNLAASGVDDARIVEAAVSDAAGTVRLDVGRRNLGQAKVVSGEGAADGETIEVPARTLLDILQDADIARVDLMKIDIEGHEMTALAPFFRDAPAALHPAAVLIEQDPAQKDALHDLLTGAGYRLARQLPADALYQLDRTEPSRTSARQTRPKV